MIFYCEKLDELLLYTWDGAARQSYWDADRFIMRIGDYVVAHDWVFVGYL